MDTHSDSASKQGHSGKSFQITNGLLSQVAAWLVEREIAFRVTSIGMIVMLLWAGSYKMTVPGAEGIIPLVSNSPLISWHFKIFGPYILSG